MHKNWIDDRSLYGGKAPERVTPSEYKLLHAGGVVRGLRMPDDGPFLLVPEPDATPVVGRVLRRFVIRGGPGSGHHGHEGRPGERGGSLPGDGGGWGVKPDGKYPRRISVHYYTNASGELREVKHETPDTAEAFRFAAEHWTEGSTIGVDLFDDDRGVFAAFMSSKDNLPDISKVNLEQEVSTVFAVYDHFRSVLLDPKFQALAAKTDEDGLMMVDAAIKQVQALADPNNAGTPDAGRPPVFSRFNGFGMNVVLTNGDNYGAGSGGPRGAKVFWVPVSMPSQDNVIEQRATMAFGVSPVYVLTHELHHAYGSGSELDNFSTAVAADFYMQNPGLLGDAQRIRRDMEGEMHSLYSYAANPARGERAESIVGARTLTAWLYERHPDYFEGVWSRREQDIAGTLPETADVPKWYADTAQARGRMERWVKEYLRSPSPTSPMPASPSG